MIAILALAAIRLCLTLLARRTFVGAAGLSGCVIDIVILSALPVIWYVSVGGTDVLPAYMLKTQLTVLTMGSSP